MHPPKNNLFSGPVPDLLFSVLLGLAFMELVVGLDKINPAFTSWLLLPGSDIVYHYLSWEYFKDTAWAWPPGKLEGYAYPMYNSIMYTDSIPLLAFLFKMIRFFLPNDFQYFGFWYALCFILNTYFGVILLKHIGWGRGLRWLLAPLFTGAVVLIARFGHAALCGQWVILYSLFIYLNRDNWEKAKIFRHLYRVVFMTSLIHPYLLFMVLGLATAVPLRLKLDLKITIWNFWKQILVFILLTLTGWYLSGAFLFKGQLSEGLGRYSANLNTFFNAWDVGRWGPSFKYYGDGQGEGIAYLGLGVLFILIILTVNFLKHQFNVKKPALPIRNQSVNMYFIICLLFFVFALSPKWALGEYLFIDWGYNDYISRTFRGTGRFSWPLFYFILYFSCKKLYQLHTSTTVKYALVISTLFLQAFDLTPLWKRKPYIDQPPFQLAYIDQIRFLISKCDKVIIYPPYSSTIADFGDYIYFTDLAQREKKPISTGYGARFPAYIGKAFRDSLQDMPSYLSRYPGDLIITHTDSVSLHQRWLREIKGISFQFDRYRIFVSDSIKSRIDLDRFDPGSMVGILHSDPVPLIDYLKLNINHIILGSVYEEGVLHLKHSTRDYLKQLGLNGDSLRYGSSWAFILQGQKVKKQSISMNTVVELNDTLKCGIRRIPVQIKSGGYQAGKVVSITVNLEQMVQSRRGLSLVVMDSCGKILDRVRYDTYLTDEYLERKENW